MSRGGDTKTGSTPCSESPPHDENDTSLRWTMRIASGERTGESLISTIIRKREDVENLETISI
jgi:hypothetical protein